MNDYLHNSKKNRFIFKIIIVSSIITLLMSLSFVASASKYHGGGICMMLSASYKTKEITYTANYDKDVFDVLITDWNFFEEELTIEKGTDYYTIKSDSILSQSSPSAPWFRFVPKESAEPGTYPISVLECKTKPVTEISRKHTKQK